MNWEQAEDAGLVRLRFEPEEENYFDVYGEPDDPEERAETVRLIETHGVWWVVAEYLSQDDGSWRQADSIGMLFGNDLGTSPDAARLAAAEAVFPELPAEVRAEIGERP